MKYIYKGENKEYISDDSEMWNGTFDPIRFDELQPGDEIFIPNTGELLNWLGEEEEDVKL